MTQKRDHALLNDRLVSRICAAVVAKLEQDFFQSVPSKQGVAGSNPVSRSTFFLRLQQPCLALPELLTYDSPFSVGIQYYMYFA